MQVGKREREFIDEKIKKGWFKSKKNIEILCCSLILKWRRATRGFKRKKGEGAFKQEKVLKILNMKKY